MEIKKKVIWLICLNAQPPEFDTHLRHQKFANLLINNGYEVYIIAGSFLYYNNINLIENGDKFIEKRYGKLKYIFINTPSTTKNGFKRIYSTIKFGLNIYRLKKEIYKPDIVIHNLRVPFDFLIYFATRKLKAKYITEVWDLWPESFKAYGLLKKNNPLLLIAYQVEKFLYKKADKMIFTMEGAKEYIRNKKWDVDSGGPICLDKLNYINNGIDIEEFNNNIKLYSLKDPDLENNMYFNVIYLGSIRLVNNLMDLIKVAEILKTNKKIRFLIYGDGDDRVRIEKYCELNKVSNVVFKEKWVNIKYVPYVLSRGSLHVLNYIKNDIFQYGVSQGKLFQYLASGKPIVANNVMGYDIIKKYNVGISETFNSVEEYAKAIQFFADLPEKDYRKFCLRTLEAAKEFDYKNLFKNYLKVIETLD